MGRIGFIGYGHMGSVLIKGFLKSRAIEPSRLILSTRTKGKLEALRDMYPEILIAEDNRAVAKAVDLLFLCVGTLQVKSVLAEIQDSLRADSHLVFISGGLELASVEACFEGPVTKMMPTILAEVLEGTTLVCHGDRVGQEARKKLRDLLRGLGSVREIDERRFEVGADLTSCAPGLLAAICDHYVRAGMRRGDFDYEEAQSMLSDSLYGTAKLLRENGGGFRSIIERVATKGGATEAGTQVFEEALPDVFARAFSAMMERHESRKLSTREQFGRG
jgi:pyrroline-5-carboxylate reductase